VTAPLPNIQYPIPASGHLLPNIVHFGRLLREGKLRKIAAGQFTVSDRINFRPEERIAG